MTTEISFGWWIAPAAITALAILLAYLKQDRSTGDYAEAGRFVFNIALYLIATIPSLIAWLIWSLAA